MKRWILMLVTAAGGAAAAAEVFLDGYAAVVNDKVITVSDVLRAIQSADRRAAATLSGPRLDETLEQHYREGFKSLIERELILTEVTRRELSLPDVMIDQQVNQVVRDRFKNNRAAFLSALEKDGLTLAAYRTQVHDDLRVMLLRRQEVTERIRVRPADVRAAYEAATDRYRVPEQVHVRLLVLRSGATEEETVAKRVLADGFRNRVRKGESFESIVRQLSEGPRADEGGDLGWVKPSDLHANLAAAVATMAPGDTSAAIDIGDEIHVLHLVDRKAPGVRPLSDVQAEIEHELETKAMEQRLEEWIGGLRVQNYVRVFQPERP